MFIFLQLKVDQLDATLIEQELDKFTIWDEGAEWVQVKKIPIDKLSEFFDHLMKTYSSSGM